MSGQNHASGAQCGFDALVPSFCIALTEATDILLGMPKGHEKESSKTVQASNSESGKDIRDISNILQILDSKVLKTNPFGGNITGDNSYKRAERISAALHLITNHVPESEPLRSAIRGAGLRLLGHILELRTAFRSIASEKGQMTLAAIRELVSFVRLLAVAGYVSAQNVNAIAEALDELGSLISVSQQSALAEQMNISREDLVPPTPPATRSDVSPRDRKVARVRIKDIRDTNDTQNTNRTDQILDILKFGGVLGIKDIAMNLPQYSEKMVQRGLAELVHMNRIEKIGAKRWSRYKLIP